MVSARKRSISCSARRRRKRSRALESAFSTVGSSGTCSVVARSAGAGAGEESNAGSCQARFVSVSSIVALGARSAPSRTPPHVTPVVAQEEKAHSTFCFLLLARVSSTCKISRCRSGRRPSCPRWSSLPTRRSTSKRSPRITKVIPIELSLVLKRSD